MAIVHECAMPGCDVLTMGELCVEHERSSAARRVPKSKNALLKGLVRERIVGQVRAPGPAGLALGAAATLAV